MKKVKYSQKQFQNDIKEIINHYKQYEKLDTIKNIYGIPRGGLIPAVYLSHALDLDLITDKNRISNKTLVVDDISDTGETLEKLLKDRKYFAVATLWICEDTKFTPTFTCRSKTSDEWIIYPWETEESTK